MRNTIKVLDKDIPKVTVRSLEPGQMYRYPKKTNDQNVYMKTTEKGDQSITVILLASGAVYPVWNLDLEVEVVDAIQISR